MTPTDLTNEIHDKRIERRKAELSLYSLESDRTRLERQQAELGSVIAGLRRTERETAAQIEEYEQHLQKIETELTTLEADIHKAQKAIRTL